MQIRPHLISTTQVLKTKGRHCRTQSSARLQFRLAIFIQIEEFNQDAILDFVHCLQTELVDNFGRQSQKLKIKI